MNTRFQRSLNPETINSVKDYEHHLQNRINNLRTHIQQPNPDQETVRVAMIYFSVGQNMPIPDDIFNMARQKNINLFYVMEETRIKVLRNLLRIAENAPLGTTPANTMQALQVLLNHETFSNQSLVDVISAYPSSVNEIMTVKVDAVWDGQSRLFWSHQVDKSTGNTLLHQLIVEKELNQIKAYMSAIYQAKQSGVAVPFDAEKKNQDNKSILQLAFETGNKDIVSAVLVYANPARTTHENQIANLNINIPEIMRQQQNLLLETTSAINRRQQIMSNVQQQTLANMGVLAIQQANTDAQVQQIGYVTAVNTAAVQAIGNHVGVQLALPPNSTVRVEELPDPTGAAALPQPAPLLQITNQPASAQPTAANDPNRLFAPTPVAPAQTNRLAQLRNARAENTALTHLTNIRAEMNTLRNRLTQLEQQVTQIESTLTVNNRANTMIRLANAN
jgi:formiminotetrahydrofolate cyclodeaminase